MLLASVKTTPVIMSGAAAGISPNNSPHTMMAEAVATITVFRSNLSPMNRPMIGPIGAEIAMSEE